jgi:hypothetical protein
MKNHILTFKCPQCKFIVADCKFDRITDKMNKHVCFQRHLTEKFKLELVKNKVKTVKFIDFKNLENPIFPIEEGKQSDPVEYLDLKIDN